MEKCTHCEQTFKGYAPLVLTVNKSGADILVYAKNNSPNILLIKRMLLCLQYTYGYSVLYIREGGFFDFFIGGERLEQGMSHLKFRISSSNAQKAQAEAEYIEAIGRSVSCVSEFTS